MKRSVFLLAFLFATQFIFSNLLHDVIDGQFRAKTLPEIHFLNDGKHYTTMSNQSLIVKYSVKTSAATDTVFDLSKLNAAPIKSFSDYQFSPNEAYILIQANVDRRYRHSFTADHYIYDIKKKSFSTLSEYGKQEQPLFSPDSRYLAFVRDNNLFLKKIEFNTEQQITKDGKQGEIINGHADWVYEEEFAQTRYFEWSPDSKKIAFLKFNESKVPEFSFQVFDKEKQDSNSLKLYPDDLEFKYPKAGDTNSTVGLYIYDDRTKNTLPVLLDTNDNDYYLPRIKWTKHPEGKLAVFKLNRDQNNLDMYLVNSKSGATKLIFSEKDPYYVNYELIDYMQFTNDNKFFFHLSERDGYRHIYRYHINGVLDKQLSSGKWEVSNFYGYDEKTKTLYYQSSETSPLRTNVYAMSLKGKKTRLTKDIGRHDALFSPNFSYFIDNNSALEIPNRISIKTNKGVEMHILEENKQLSEKFNKMDLPKKEFFSFTSSEGIELNGWILKPKEEPTEKGFPLLLLQYSGPGSQMVKDRWQVGWEYYLAQNGYVVACVDGRGTGARGAEFLKCTYRQLGVLETKDQIEAAKYLGAQDFIDKTRIGIWGWSFGGFMALRALSTDEEIFKVGIAVAPVTDWRLYNTAYTERYMRRPQENFAGYNASSPLLKAENLKGKLLIIHGTADDNVHVQNTLIYIKRLVEADKQFEMQLYTDKNHSITGKQTQKHLYTRKTDFLFKNL